jgi:hypothetical protein
MTREEELPELDKLKGKCPVEIRGDAAGDKTVKGLFDLFGFFFSFFLSK